MASNRKHTTAVGKAELSERAFVMRVTVVSLTVLAILMGIFALVWKNRDPIFTAYSAMQAESGRYEGAIKTAEQITNEEAKTQSRYTIATAMYDSGTYAEAAELFASLGDFSDSADRKLRCDYALADLQYQAGEYEAALTAFAALGNFSDSPQRQKQVIYAMAERAAASDDTAAAISLYLSVEDYGDSYDRAYDMAFTLTGDRDMALSMLESGGQTPEMMEKVLQIAERRNFFPNTQIAAGAYHTVVLYPDGTVDACGDDSYGQCQVQSWRDIVQIAAGAYHTVGLKADGTVVAAGRNDHGQCDAGVWKNITQIAAGDSDTFALSREGQVAMCGYHAYDSITRAVDVRNIYAGSYGAAAETASGTFVTSHRSLAFLPRSRVLSMDIQTGYALTQYLDGTLASSFDIGGDWADIVTFAAGPNAIVAADLHGNVRAHFFRNGDALDVSDLENILQCAAGTAHYVFLTEEGTLIARGDNTYGQCDVDTLKPLT